MGRNVSMMRNEMTGLKKNPQEIILIVEAMHLKRGKNNSRLNDIANGKANKNGKKYIVVHLDLATENGGTAMRAEVARQTHLLIQAHRPNRVIMAVDYNEGNSGGACTLEDLSRLLMTPAAELNLPSLLIDGKVFRDQRAEQGISTEMTKLQNQEKQNVLISYVLDGGDLKARAEAALEFGNGPDSDWMKWQAAMISIMRGKKKRVRPESTPPNGSNSAEAEMKVSEPLKRVRRSVSESATSSLVDTENDLFESGSLVIPQALKFDRAMEDDVLVEKSVPSSPTSSSMDSPPRLTVSPAFFKANDSVAGKRILLSKSASNSPMFIARQLPIATDDIQHCAPVMMRSGN